MNATLLYIDLRNEFEAANLALKRMAFQLRQAADHIYPEDQAEYEASYPDAAEVNAALARKRTAMKAMNDAWETLPENHRIHLIEPAKHGAW